MSDNSVIITEFKLPWTLYETFSNGKEISIYADDRGRYWWLIKDFRHQTTTFDSLQDCMTDLVRQLYNEYLDLKIVAEKHHRLVESLRESLKTPWNKL